MNLKLSDNHRRILDLLRSRGPMSRAELARESNLAGPTLSRISHSLLDINLINESHKIRGGQRGKPGQLIQLNPKGCYALGLSLQTEFLSGCIVDLEGRECGSSIKPFETPEHQIVERLTTKMVEELISDSGIDRKKIIGAGVSMPGMALHKYGNSVRPTNMDRLPDEFKEWKNIELQSFFEKSTGFPCWLENSSTAATLAEMHFGVGQRLSHFAVVHIAFGFGGGLVLERRLYSGAFGRAGEFGGMYPYSEPRPSGRDLLIFLSQNMEKSPKSVREIASSNIPDNILNLWVERVYPSLHELARFLSMALDLQGIVLNGLIPMPILEALAQLLRKRLPSTIRSGFGMPEIVVSHLAESSVSIGSASLPLHFSTSASATSLA